MLLIAHAECGNCVRPVRERGVETGHGGYSGPADPQGHTYTTAPLLDSTELSPSALLRRFVRQVC
jgi:hypothetical protein